MYTTQLAVPFLYPLYFVASSLRLQVTLKIMTSNNLFTIIYQPDNKSRWNNLAEHSIKFHNTVGQNVAFSNDIFRCLFFIQLLPCSYLVCKEFWSKAPLDVTKGMVHTRLIILFFLPSTANL